MKNLILITIAAFTLQATAQRPNMGQQENMMNQRMSYLKDLSAEQLANLQTKRMTLQLDLTETQINKVYGTNLATVKVRKEKMTALKNKENKGKPSNEDLYKKMMARLDHRIAYKKEMKAILNKEQFEKWEKMLTQRFSDQGQNFGGRPDHFNRG